MLLYARGVASRLTGRADDHLYIHRRATSAASKQAQRERQRLPGSHGSHGESGYRSPFAPARQRLPEPGRCRHLGEADGVIDDDPPHLRSDLGEGHVVTIGGAETRHLLLDGRSRNLSCTP